MSQLVLTCDKNVETGPTPIPHRDGFVDKLPAIARSRAADVGAGLAAQQAARMACHESSWARRRSVVGPDSSVQQ